MFARPVGPESLTRVPSCRRAGSIAERVDPGAAAGLAGIRSRWNDRKLDHVRQYLEQAEREGRFGVVAVVVAEEFQRVWSARNRSGKPGVAALEFFWEKRRVGAYYFYILDPEFGPAFIKICTYGPWSAKVWVNGHEWVKRQAAKAGIAFTALSNGFAACDQPERLQAICDSFSPEHVQAFFDRWICQIPTPLSAEDRAAGYWWELSTRQVEVSRTLGSTTPRRARSFFEALVADNIGIGRPEQVSMVFARQLSRPTRHPYQTRIFSSGTEVRIDFRYKHSRVKQYLKDGPRAADRDRHQPTRRPRRQTPPAPPPRTDRQSPRRQPTTAYHRTGRPEPRHSALRSTSASTSPTTERAKEPERCASGTFEQ